MLGPHHNAVHDLALLDRAIRRGFLDVRLDDVADTGIPLPGLVQNANRPRDPRAGIVGHIQVGTQLNHAATFSTCRDFSTTCTSAHRFSLLNGRVSLIRTRSPTPASLFSSCA